jgi:hypothetical protein
VIVRETAIPLLTGCSGLLITVSTLYHITGFKNTLRPSISGLLSRITSRSNYPFKSGQMGVVSRSNHFSASDPSLKKPFVLA